jgi:hypothetical protein
MSLVKKKVTPKLLLAVQTNGHRSAGPRTAAGKNNSSMNAIKHGAFAQVGLPHMRALGEDPAEFARHLECFRSAFKPEDGYEEVLVKEIAVLHWRLERLKRGEAGFLASRMQNLQRDREWKAHLARRARIDAFRDYTAFRELKDLRAIRADPKSVHYSDITPEGDMNSPESPEKYATILRTLTTSRDLFLRDGFDAIRASNLELVLGDGANCRGSDLVSTFQACSTDLEKQPAETQEYRHNYFLQALEEEIRYFEKEFQLYLAREVEVSPEMADAQLLPSSEDLDRIIRYENNLERLIELKRMQLFEWRREKANANSNAHAPSSLAMPAFPARPNGNGKHRTVQLSALDREDYGRLHSTDKCNNYGINQK